MPQDSLNLPNQHIMNFIADNADNFEALDNEGISPDDIERVTGDTDLADAYASWIYLNVK